MRSKVFDKYQRVFANVLADFHTHCQKQTLVDKQNAPDKPVESGLDHLQDHDEKQMSHHNTGYAEPKHKAAIPGIEMYSDSQLRLKERYF